VLPFSARKGKWPRTHAGEARREKIHRDGLYVSASHSKKKGTAGGEGEGSKEGRGKEMDGPKRQVGITIFLSWGKKEVSSPFTKKKRFREGENPGLPPEGEKRTKICRLGKIVICKRKGGETVSVEREGKHAGGGAKLCSLS